MNRLLSLLIVIALIIPEIVFTIPSGKRIEVSETVIYVAEVNPLTGNYTIEYKSTITVRNDGESAKYRFKQRLFGVEASTLELPKEARLAECSEEFCLLEWVVQANPGTSIFEIRGKPLWTPLSIDVNIMVNEMKPMYSSAYGVFFVESKEDSAVEWRIRLRNNNPILLDSMTNISSKPPVFVSVSMTLPERYFKNIVYNPPINTTSILEKDTVSWILIIREDVEINVKAVIRSFDDWGTIPLTPISISFSPMVDSVRDSISSKLKSLNMSLSMMKMILLPLGNFTSLIKLMNTMLGNLSYALESTGNQTIMISDVLNKIGSQLGHAAYQLSDAASMLSKIMEDVSKVDFQRIRQVLDSSRGIAHGVFNSTLRVIAGVENELLEIKGILMNLRNNLTDPDQIELIDSAIERIDNLYNNLKNFEKQLKTAQSQIDSLFNSIVPLINILEEYRSKALGMSSGLSAGISALSQVSSALSEISSALRLIGEANIMMGGNITSIMPILENVSLNLGNVKESLEGNMTSLKKAYEELSTFLRLIDHGENRVRLMAPDSTHENTLFFKPVFSEYDNLLRLNALLLENKTRIGVRIIKVRYNGTFRGVLLDDSKILEGSPELGMEFSGDSITISQFSYHDEGNLLMFWNGQEFSLLFSNNSQVIVEVDYSILDELGERSEVLSYSIIQPTLGKGFNIVFKPNGENQPLKTGLNIVMSLLIAASIVVIVILLYAFVRKREVIIF
ncbi:MAG: hypothetical protein NZ873_02845 [Crenarchaeota archaeon]|nr:hypothetical protein [Thermoproteota archaeon]MDW8033510.1 hypothetical protein [Nitrososphaerota archaeon]